MVLLHGLKCMENRKNPQLVLSLEDNALALQASVAHLCNPLHIRHVAFDTYLLRAVPRDSYRWMTYEIAAAAAWSLPRGMDLHLSAHHKLQGFLTIPFGDDPS